MAPYSHLNHMTFPELLLLIKSDKLSKEQLEHYSDKLAELFADMQIEIANLEEQESLFMAKEIEKSVAQRKIEWKVTPSGLRLNLLKRWSVACSKIINSVKSRVYRLIY